MCAAEAVSSDKMIVIQLFKASNPIEKCYRSFVLVDSSTSSRPVLGKVQIAQPFLGYRGGKANLNVKLNTTKVYSASHGYLSASVLFGRTVN